MDDIKALRKELRDFRTEMEDRVRMLEKAVRMKPETAPVEVAADLKIPKPKV